MGEESCARRCRSILVGAGVVMLILVVPGGCISSKSSQGERRERADMSRQLVLSDFQDYRARIPSTMWSDAAVAGYLPCGRGRVKYLVQSPIGFYSDKASSAQYLLDIQHSLDASGWIRKSGGNDLDFWLRKSGNELHLTGYKGVSHARSWLYGACLNVGQKLASELDGRSKEHCMSTIRVKGVTATPAAGALCSWGRIP